MLAPGSGFFLVAGCPGTGRCGGGRRLSLSGLVSLRHFVGLRNRALAPLAPGGHRSFPAAGLNGAGFAGAVLFSCPLENIGGRPAARCAVPPVAALTA